MKLHELDKPKEMIGIWKYYYLPKYRVRVYISELIGSVGLDN
ncbi:hypothetical protein HYP07_gp014 [Vibrio phage JSF3]|uniref:Uncharacterized protein n=2 Tax=Pacinivirus VCO139 TaxID=2846607 RepID=R9R4H6_9CAUD|nr:hypothetical protein M612_gp28 [Vibrio phage JA-1]YP_009874377.1 hypothetical protein HYO77_gp28 [Vibrio phage VCO139]YP_009876239.1 hypothetical protein HYP07_gp014 [Vibrio phage JSF3]AGI61827.1 hypothetical protein JA1_0075 [Vibrio phage JA-1]AGI61902.1 hypothetical protein VCO139_0076 [Vibrio phage VCO139]APD18026.1 hypothetical protein [Vibrio phage JSF3]